MEEIYQGSFKSLLNRVSDENELSWIRENFNHVSKIQKSILRSDINDSNFFSYSWSKTEKRKNRYTDIFPFDYNRVVLGDNSKPSPPELIVKTINDIEILQTQKTVDIIGREYTPSKKYINASWIQSPTGISQSEYIATQGPTRGTVGDFWQMVFERRCPAIVMLANIIEKEMEKCTKYWPDARNPKLEFKEMGLVVLFINEKYILNNNAVVRDFIVISSNFSDDAKSDTNVLGSFNSGNFGINTNNDASINPDIQRGALKVTQFQYFEWPDTMVPNSFTEVLDLLLLVRNSIQSVRESTMKMEKKFKVLDNNTILVDAIGPPVVHCSAGCGRTGTWCVLDTCIDYFNNNGDYNESTSDCSRCSVDQIIEYFSVDPEIGLTSLEAARRAKLYGFNVLEKPEEESLFMKFIKGIFTNHMVLLLLGSSVISVIIGNYDDAFSITLAILIVSTVGFIQEYRSEQTLKALSDLVPHYCSVIRNGQHSTVNADNLVPGDIVTFATGDRIPADVRLIQAVHLEIDESSLTGESESRHKSINVTDHLASNYSENSHNFEEPKSIYPPQSAELSFSDQINIGFMGTLVRNGHGKGIVSLTGSNTEFGKIHAMIQEIEEPRTPLQKNMDVLGAQLSMLSFGVIGVILLIGLIQGKGFMNMFTISVSLAVAAIPEGLSIVVTVTLAVGVFKMAKRKAICKKLPSVETLGSTSVICVDKTGTLTMNKMEVQHLYTVSEGLVTVTDSSATRIYSSWSYTQLLKVGNLCNNAKINEKGELIGQATDIAMFNVALKIRGVDERDRYTRISERPFNSEAKLMSVTYPESADSEFARINVNHHDQSQQKVIVYMKGSIENIIDLCDTHYSYPGEKKVMTDSVRSEVLTHAENLSHRGLRVVATAIGESNEKLSFVGFEVMKDPPRVDVDLTIARLIKAGVRVVMITGDSEDTALAIASSVGIPVSSEASSCLTGKQLDMISDVELSEKIRGISVFARSTPRHKVQIVRALQSIGETVGMTGDGVNDAPALRLADIGISMGHSGTEIFLWMGRQHNLWVLNHQIVMSCQNPQDQRASRY
ncbi:hypothetical protein BB558_003126 [Smittium angustum]|uniref:Calcium-transporting ATPase n=1 Tax=Smittium angustum TaxID=133377 RepID=A0A2U1J6Y8_SMIAN|nr:hypothetical protein BB558_003126 [Smittium angustum]